LGELGKEQGLRGAVGKIEKVERELWAELENTPGGWGGKKRGRRR